MSRPTGDSPERDAANAAAERDAAERVIETELAERDERVAASIMYKVKYQRDLAAQMRSDAAELEKSARATLASAKAERWWELAGILERADVESLCAVSPTDLLGGES